jgi:serine/threonine-protein kinase
MDFTPGSVVGRYEILKRIGAGGMAEVYLCRPTGGAVDARVAIKRLLPAFAHEPRFVDMFIAEARLAATLHHPNIAKVFEAVIGTCGLPVREACRHLCQLILREIVVLV